MHDIKHEKFIFRTLGGFEFANLSLTNSVEDGKVEERRACLSKRKEIVKEIVLISVSSELYYT